MKNIQRLIFLLALLPLACSEPRTVGTADSGSEPQQAAQEVTYSNPVLAGDYADPAVVRVGEDYWATATSSEWAPLFPILHSRNLVDWEIVAHVFPNQLPDWAEAHFWAPEIAYESGKFYIYYTAKKKGGNLCVGVASASEARGPYTDHGPLVCQEVGSIDGFPIRDEKGDLYLVWKEDGNSRGLPTPIWAQRMNEERTQLTGEKFELFRNDPDTWEGGLVEGPFLHRRGEYFYAFYSGDACCGRGCTYGVGVARARSLRGPWEKSEKNPLMKQNAHWKCAGHGSMVSDPEGNDYFLYHAYSTDGTVYTGRQGLLDQIFWGDDGWPFFSDDAPSIMARAPHQQDEPDALAVEDEFRESRLHQGWQWPVDKWVQYNLVPENGGMLSLQASPDKIGRVLARRTTTPDYVATASLDMGKLPAGTMAGLSAIGDQDNATGIALHNGEIVLWMVKEGKASILAGAKAPPGNSLQLRFAARKGDQLEFAWSPDGQQWQTLNANGPVDASYLPPWDRAVRVGLTVKGPENSRAAFDWFRLDPVQE